MSQMCNGINQDGANCMRNCFINADGYCRDHKNQAHALTRYVVPKTPRPRPTMNIPFGFYHFGPYGISFIQPELMANPPNPLILPAKAVEQPSWVGYIV